MSEDKTPEEVVEILYEGRLEDGTVFDSNRGDDASSEPLSIVLGRHDIIPGLERALETMQPGEKREIVVAPEDAYGFSKPQAIQRTRRSMLKNGDTLTEGMTFKMMTPASTTPIDGKVVHIHGDFVEIDFNHPLAGKTLIFDVEMLSRRPV